MDTLLDLIVTLRAHSFVSVRRDFLEINSLQDLFREPFQGNIRISSDLRNLGSGGKQAGASTLSRSAVQKDLLSGGRVYLPAVRPGRIPFLSALSLSPVRRRWGGGKGVMQGNRRTSREGGDPEFRRFTSGGKPVGSHFRNGGGHRSSCPFDTVASADQVKRQGCS